MINENVVFWPTFWTDIGEFGEQSEAWQHRQHNTLMSLDWFADFHASTGDDIDQPNRDGVTEIRDRNCDLGIWIWFFFNKKFFLVYRATDYRNCV